MNDEIKLYLKKFPYEITYMFNKLRQLILDVDTQVEEKMWAKIPTY